MKNKIIHENESGTEHFRTHVKHVDIDEEFGRCLYCTLEFECQSAVGDGQGKGFCHGSNGKYLYRTKEMDE